MVDVNKAFPSAKGRCVVGVPTGRRQMGRIICTGKLGCFDERFHASHSRFKLHRPTVPIFVLESELHRQLLRKDEYESCTGVARFRGAWPLFVVRGYSWGVASNFVGRGHSPG